MVHYPTKGQDRRVLTQPRSRRRRGPRHLPAGYNSCRPRWPLSTRFVVGFGWGLRRKSLSLHFTTWPTLLRSPHAHTPACPLRCHNCWMDAKLHGTLPQSSIGAQSHGRTAALGKYLQPALPASLRGKLELAQLAEHSGSSASIVGFSAGSPSTWHTSVTRNSRRNSQFSCPQRRHLAAHS